MYRNCVIRPCARLYRIHTAAPPDTRFRTAPSPPQRAGPSPTLRWMTELRSIVGICRILLFLGSGSLQYICRMLLFLGSGSL